MNELRKKKLSLALAVYGVAAAFAPPKEDREGKLLPCRKVSLARGIPDNVENLAPHPNMFISDENRLKWDEFVESQEIEEEQKNPSLSETLDNGENESENTGPKVLSMEEMKDFAFKNWDGHEFDGRKGEESVREEFNEILKEKEQG